MKCLNITQSYTGTYSHRKNFKGIPKDYPTDNAGVNTGKDWIYCPCDEMKIVRIYGVGNSKKTNTIWLESTSKCVFPDGSKDYLTAMFIHSNDSQLKKLKVGQKFERKEKMFKEGNDGCMFNHIHASFGKGKIKNNGWVKNNLGKWVLCVTGKTCKPEQILFLDKSFTTTTKKTQGITFKKLPKDKE